MAETQTEPHDQEEGEILEDGEIADDEDGDALPLPMETMEGSDNDKAKTNKKFKEGPFMTRTEFPPEKKRRKKTIDKERKKKRKIKSPKPMELGVIERPVDISQWLHDASFDAVSLSDEDEYCFDSLDYDSLMEILGCSANQDVIDMLPTSNKRKNMLRIMKIMKEHFSHERDLTRRFARVKRRAKDGTGSIGGMLGAGAGVGGGSGNRIIDNRPRTLCKFFMEGKCQKGLACTFSHDCNVPKRKDLCKFYLHGYCAKGTDCLFMHGEFPCKFYHTNTECYQGENCRFSHAPLTEETRAILRNYLDSGTLPDDPRPPFKSYYSDWPKNNKRNNHFREESDYRAEVDPNRHTFGLEHDTQAQDGKQSPEPDSNLSPETVEAYNYETEQLLSRPRKVLLGEPSQNVRISWKTWKWQQDMKQLKQEYTGHKSHLYTVDSPFTINEKPPSPTNEMEEEEIETHIMNYYKETLDTDELDELMQLREIEEHTKAQEEAKLNNDFDSRFGVPAPLSLLPDEISEEERRLIEASAHDEDLRFLPPGSTFTIPAVFGPAESIVNQTSSTDLTTVNSAYYGPSDTYTGQFNGLDHTSASLPPPSQLPPPPITTPHDLVYPDVAGNYVKPECANEVSNMLHQIRNDMMSEQISAPAENLLEVRDPRLSRLKEVNRLTANQQTPMPPVPVEEKPIFKPFIKVCNPNVIVEYKLVPIDVPALDHSRLLELYRMDAIARNDPRLHARLNKTKLNSQPANSQQQPATSNQSAFTYSQLPTSTASTISSTLPPSGNIRSPPQRRPTAEVDFFALSRDPRIRLKDKDFRIQTTDTKGPQETNDIDNNNKDTDVISDVSNNYEPQTLSSSLTSSGVSLASTTTAGSLNGFVTDTTTTTTSATWPNSISSSMASSQINVTSETSSATTTFSSSAEELGLLPPIISMFSSISSGEKNSIDSSQSEYSTSKCKPLSLNSNNDDDDEDDEETLQVHIPNEDKPFENELSENKINQHNSFQANNLKSSWQINILPHADPDLRLGRRVSQLESEEDSENENELIIASSSETEDNKDGDGHSDSLQTDN